MVAPSLPGYTLSFKPGQRRFGVNEIADLYAELMSDVLGYQRFGIQGGDWGAFIASSMGHRLPQRVTGIHLNFLAASGATRRWSGPDTRGEGLPRASSPIS